MGVTIRIARFSIKPPSPRVGNVESAGAYAYMEPRILAIGSDERLEDFFSRRLKGEYVPLPLPRDAGEYVPPPPPPLPRDAGEYMPPPLPRDAGEYMPPPLPRGAS